MTWHPQSQIAKEGEPGPRRAGGHPANASTKQGSKRQRQNQASLTFASSLAGEQVTGTLFGMLQRQQRIRTASLDELPASEAAAALDALAA